ncbi:hypothetical protein Tco_0720978 [Tanacetum coccineum]
MAPKRTTRSGPATTTTITSVTDAQLKAMIDQGVTAAWQQTAGHNVAYAMTWIRPKKKMTGTSSWTGNEMKKLEAELWNLKVKESDKIKRYVGGLLDMIHGSVVASRPKIMQDAIKMATKLMDKKIRTFAKRLTLQGLVRRNHIEDLNPYAKNATITTTVHVLPNATSATELAIWPVTVGVLRILMLVTIKGALGQVRKLLAMNVVPKDISRGSDQSLRTQHHEMGSFDVIIGMDWLSRYQAIIVCAEKIIRIPWGNETLIVHGNGSNRGNKTRLNIISCTKAQEYMLKGCQVFLAQVTTKEAEDKSKKKRLEDVPIVQDFPEVFPEDLPGLTLTRQVEFKIDLIPGIEPVARAPYRLAPFKMKELSEQLQELSDKGFIRPNSSP